MTPSQEILSRLRITDVWRILGGSELRNRRGRAWWREGHGWSISLNDARGIWFDHRDGVGGVVDLVVRVRGGNKQDALRWLADFAGVPLETRRLSAADRAHWAQQHHEAELVATEATYFASAATQLAELALEDDVPLTNPYRPALTALLKRLRIAPEAEYLVWKQDNSAMSEALVHAGRQREQRLERIILSYLDGGAQ